MESTVARLESIGSKVIGWNDRETGERQTANVYQFTLAGFKKPFETFDKDLADMRLQGRMVKVSYTTKERNWTANDGSGRSGTTTDYRLEHIVAVEGDEGTLNDVMAPVARQEATQSVVERTNGDTPSSPSEAIRQAEIRRAVALKAAVEFANGKIAAGEEQSEKNILEYTNNFQAILESR